MNLSFKNRIALHYMLATASVMALVFFIIYFVVHAVVYRELDEDLAYEAHKHTKEIYVVKDSIVFNNKEEWEEREHREVQVNPVFVQIVNNEGQVMDQSPNLKEGVLIFHSDKKIDTHFDTKLNNQAIRQVQIPIQQKGVQKGYILTAMSQEGAIVVLENLRETLLLLFPILLIALFVITRFLAGRSIIPVKTITQTANKITKNNLNERISLPDNKDELYSLTSSINELLDRIQNVMEREKQFTADASHQLRTPLAVLKGTLEVLVRKPRSETEYREKINYSIQEIDRISEIVNQLLILARFDKNNQKISDQEVNLQVSIDDILQRLRTAIQHKEIFIDVKTNGVPIISSDPYYVDLILENILLNAIKYSYQQGKITIDLQEETDAVKCAVTDNGIGIQAGDLENIFRPFFRSDELNHKEIKGNGLGLSIVKKACEVLYASVDVKSEVGEGTTFVTSFRK